MRVSMAASIVGLVVTIVSAAPRPVFAQSDCRARLEAAEAAAQALRDCLRSGMGCQKEFAARDETAAAAKGCETSAPPTPDASAAVASPASVTTSGTMALLIEGLPDTATKAAERAIREALPGATFVEAGAVRAARAFLGSAEITDERAEALRASLNASRVIVLRAKAEGATWFLQVHAADAGGSTTRYGEATTDTVAAQATLLVTELGPIAAPDTRAVAAAPGPAPAATPVKTWKPRRTRRKKEPRFPYIDLNLFLGHKSLSNDDWGRLDSQAEGGVITTIGKATWPVYSASDVFRSSGSATAGDARVFADVTELAIGPRFMGGNRFRPHVGAGLAMIVVSTRSSFQGTEASDGGLGTGFWASAGVVARLGSAFNLGLMARYSTARVVLDGGTVDGGGFHVGATLGVGLGAAFGDAD